MEDGAGELMTEPIAGGILARLIILGGMLAGR